MFSIQGALLLAAVAAWAAPPPEVARLLAQAEQAAEAGYAKDRPADFDRAVAVADQVLKLAPNHAAAHAVRAVANAGRWRLDEAAADADAAVRLGPADPRTHDARGRVRTTRGDYAAAVADFTEAVRLDPTRGRSFARRGAVRAELRDPAAAADFATAVRLAPADPVVYQMRAVTHRPERDFGPTLADLNRALELDPADVPARTARAVCHLTRHRKSAAAADVAEALAVNPTSGVALAVRAGVHWSYGRRGPARNDLGYAVHLQPLAPDLQLLAAAFHLDDDRPAAATAAADAVIQRYPKLAGEALLLRAVARLQANDLRSAIADCDRAVALNPRAAEPLAVRVVARRLRNQPAEAAADDLAADKLDREAALIRRADVSAALKRPADELAALDALVGLAPDCVNYRLSRAAARLDWTDPDVQVVRTRALESRADADRVLQQEPDNPAAYRLRAMACDVIEHTADATGAADRAIALDPSDPTAYLLRASLTSRTPDQAKQDADEAIRLRADGGEAYLLRGLARVEMREFATARNDLEEAVRRSPTLAEAVRAGNQRIQELDPPPQPDPPPQFQPPRVQPPAPPPPPRTPEDDSFWPSGDEFLVFLVIAAGVFVFAATATFLWCRFYWFWFRPLKLPSFKRFRP